MAQKREDKNWPWVTWYCDECGANLSRQHGFHDDCIIWDCHKCGAPNMITEDQIEGYMDQYIEVEEIDPDEEEEED